MSNLLKIVSKTLLLLIVTLAALLLAAIIIIFLLCHGPSTKARDMFVTTVYETDNGKFIAKIFLKDSTVNEILKNNSLNEIKDEVDPSLINVSVNNDVELVKIEDINSTTFSGKMMIISDPSKVFLSTSYPWDNSGEKLDNLVKKSNAVAGVNGGMYKSNLGIIEPVGVVVSNKSIKYNNTENYNNLYMVGLDEDNKLRIINISNKSKEMIESIIKSERIRDAVTCQDTSHGSINSFVKLIVNGKKRSFNGISSGKNPRTVIGQRKDGTILLLVTDGRGANSHLGASAEDLIDIMANYGAVNAANLDGGASTSMYYDGKYLNRSVTLFYHNLSWKIPTAFVVGGDK